MNALKYNAKRNLGFQHLEDRRLMTANVMTAAAIATVTEKATAVQVATVQTTTVEVAPILLPPVAPVTAPVKVAAPVVTAAVSGGVLTLTGDSGSDAVTITQPPLTTGEYQLTSTNGTEFELYNGVAALEVPSLIVKGVTGNVNITFKGTSESLSIGTSQGLNLPANLNVNMGNGANTFVMYDATVAGSMTLNGGSGTDNASISESTIGIASVNKGANDLTISLGGGANTLSMVNNDAIERDLNVLDPSSASDNIFMAENITAGRYVYINTGNGNDTVALAGVTAGSQLNIETGAGNDTVYLGGAGLGDIDPVIADSVYVDLGAGNDRLQIGYGTPTAPGGGVYAMHGTTYLGGAGTDDIWNVGFDPITGASGFETKVKF